jgi:hypothetical protein
MEIERSGGVAEPERTNVLAVGSRSDLPPALRLQILTTEHWVAGMNLLRHAYLGAAPELRPYFVTGSSDDEAGIMATFRATPGPGGLAHVFVTTPGMLAVVDGVVAGVLAGIVALRIGLDTPLTLGLAITLSLVTVVLHVVHRYRGVVKPRGRRLARFPE